MKAGNLNQEPGSEQPSKSLLEYLPGPYRSGEFISRFLAVFEKILLGRNEFIDLEKDGSAIPESQKNIMFKGLEQQVKEISSIFNPLSTQEHPLSAPENFLGWLSDWTGFILREDLSLEEQRKFLAKIIQLYKRRGTKENLKKLLQIFTIGQPTIEETEASRFQIGITSKIGVDTFVGGSPPHFFSVIIAVVHTDGATIEKLKSIASSLIDLEKPAHTSYKLILEHPTMQIGHHSSVGVDTIIGQHTGQRNEEETDR